MATVCLRLNWWSVHFRVAGCGVRVQVVHDQANHASIRRDLIDQPTQRLAKSSLVRIAARSSRNNGVQPAAPRTQTGWPSPSARSTNWRTVSGEMRRTYPNSTVWPASIRTVQWSWPPGTLLHVIAMRWLSF